MHLTRNHPALTASDWFNHMLFADSLGNGETRAIGELHEIILSALSNRNFDLDRKNPATFTIKNNATELISDGPGSRNNPFRVDHASQESSTFHISAQVKDGDNYHFQFPVQIRVEFKNGALQGAVHWTGKKMDLSFIL